MLATAVEMRVIVTLFLKKGGVVSGEGLGHLILECLSLMFFQKRGE
jgi:hypothetical protein